MSGQSSLHNHAQCRSQHHQTLQYHTAIRRVYICFARIICEITRRPSQHTREAALVSTWVGRNSCCASGQRFIAVQAGDGANSHSDVELCMRAASCVLASTPSSNRLVLSRARPRFTRSLAGLFRAY